LATENEIKLALPDALPQIRRRIRDVGFQIHKKRIHEMNVLFDTPTLDLRQQGKLIRLRRVGEDTILTYKGPPQPGKHKRREELETRLEKADAFEKILLSLGYTPVFRYEKFRAEYAKAGESGVITLDETPIGHFLEIEGSARWVDRTATALGFAQRDYITKSYGALYVDYCTARGIPPSNMLFGARKSK
jgi:adenylate cyclase, class 2